MMQRVDGKKFAKKKSRSVAFLVAFLFLLVFLWSSQNWLYQASFGLAGSKVSAWLFQARGALIGENEADELEKIRAENQKLIEENARLREELLKNNIRLDQNVNSRFKLAKIEVTGKENFFGQPLLFALKQTGSEIKSGLAVIDKNGFLVGLTEQVEARTLQIVLIPNHHFRVGAKVAGTEWSGVVAGSHDLRAVLELLPLETQADSGVSVITDNSSPDIPAGIAIGTLAQVKESDDHLFKEALIDLPWKSETFLSLWVVTGINF